jgi:hypothetical protein
MLARLLRGALASLALVSVTGAFAAGCITRPVVAGEPLTETNFTTDLQAQAVDKLDILFTIDNSASMGDKQEYLERAIPDLINRLVAPNCLDANGTAQGSSTNDGSCPAGQTVEFPPVHDMHIGIVSSSLGPRLSDQFQGGSGVVCPTTGTSSVTLIDGTSYPDHNDDQGHLLTRSSVPNTSGGPPSAATLAVSPPADAPNGFLAWFPTTTNVGGTAPVGAPAVTDPATLVSDFTDMVAGVQQFGCGIESQLESWYRFLVQPDPYATLGLDSKNRAQWVGVDTTILQQRKDFLRPDSLVAIIVLTDENDSEIDVRSAAGLGYYFMSRAWDPPHGTSACASNPADPGCQVCQPGSTDPACVGPSGNATNSYESDTDWGYNLNLRHVRMKAKYGFDPQFPIARYVTGLSSPAVPDRNGEYPSGAQSYVGNKDCTNPLFAAALPDPTQLSASIATTVSAADATTLCKLPVGTRAANLIFYGIIGGVPNELLHFDPNSPANSALSDSDWVKILGNDPEAFDYTGIDPHMVESQTPRNGTALDPHGVLAAPSAPNGTDPISGREWITNQGAHADLTVDREYACIFKLTTARDCTDPANKPACDCSTDAGVLTPEETSPVCDPETVTQQDYAKAYPTIRELLLAHKMGQQGIASSICPIHVTDQSATGSTDPLYGYRPAVSSIVNRLKGALTATCLPEKLNPDATGAVGCLVLATLPNAGDESVCTTTPGMTIPDPTILAQYRQTAEAAFLADGGAAAGLVDPDTHPICEVEQVLGADFVNGSCKATTSQSGWCYVTGAAAGACSQSIQFTSQTPPSGTKISLQCIEASAVGNDAGR